LKNGGRHETRIVGGETVQPNAYPWMVLITGNSTPACGGTLISDHYVLTAAHCKRWANSCFATTYFNLKHTDFMTEYVRISNLIIHPPGQLVFPADTPFLTKRITK